MFLQAVFLRILETLPWFYWKESIHGLNFTEKFTPVTGMILND